MCFHSHPAMADRQATVFLAAAITEGAMEGAMELASVRFFTVSAACPFFVFARYLVNR